jgi:hypothetical protein
VNAIERNDRGGWSILLTDGKREYHIGNYATETDAARALQKSRLCEPAAKNPDGDTKSIIVVVAVIVFLAAVIGVAIAIIDRAATIGGAS